MDQVILSAKYLNDLNSALKVPRLDDLRGASVLVTGPTGLIGSALVDELLWLNSECGFMTEVTLAVRDERKAAQRFAHWGGGYRLTAYDATRPVEIDGRFDYIVHAAGSAHPAAYANAPVETALSSALGTAGILELSKRSGTKRVLYLSSSEVYGVGLSGELISEEDYGYVDFFDSRSCYPESKRFCEVLCALYADEYSIDYVTVRPGHIYGPTALTTDSRAHAQFARDAADGRDIVMKSSGLQRRSYCYVADCTTAILTVLLKGASRNAYNISSPSCVTTIRELASAFARAGGVNVVFESPTDVESRGYNRMQSSALDGEKIMSLGWQGSRSVEEGAICTLEMLKYQV